VPNSVGTKSQFTKKLDSYLDAPAFIDRTRSGFGSGRRIHASHGEILVDDLVHGRSCGRIVPRNDSIHGRYPGMVPMDRDRPQRVWGVGGYHQYSDRFDRVRQDGRYGRRDRE
jgi:hypothetical protein